MNTIKVLVIAGSTFIIGLAVGYFFFPRDITSGYYIEKHSGQQKLTNKLIDFDIPPSKELGDYKNKLNSKIGQFIDQNKVEEISVYYRDLNNGPWVGIKETEQFIPASLLKVPIMIAYLKQAETNPSILTTKYTYDAKSDPYDDRAKFPPKEKMQNGKEYTIDDLIKRMITYSDNQALHILIKNIDQPLLLSIYKDLGISLPETDVAKDFMSTRSMAIFFRVLYNATYLNEKMSSKALQILTEAQFEDGLRAGVPQEVLIAHKFGERESLSGSELHDCGIVYYPKHPYTLCVMTKGRNYEDMSFVIKEISKLTYEQVDQVYSK